MQRQRMRPENSKKNFSFNPVRERSPALFIMALLAGLIGGAFAGMYAWVESWLTEFRIILASSGETSEVVLVFGAGLLAGFGFWLVFRFAPVAGGSGIPEVEGALEDIRPAPWKRVLPVKFIAGICTMASGMILGREGPSVQMGAYSGKMIADLFRLSNNSSHILLATGAAAGLAAAFNAPLAGILFVIEEMRLQFRYGFTSVKAVFIGTIAGALVVQMWMDQSPALSMPVFHEQPLQSLWLYLGLGTLFGFLGIFFNKVLLVVLDGYAKLVAGSVYRFVILGCLLGMLAAGLSITTPELTGGGLEVINDVVQTPLSLFTLFSLFILRFALTMVFYGSGAPGGIFAPMLALGTLAGLFFGYIANALVPELVTSPGVFAIAGMGALFAATVRAPLTGTVLVLEMTDNYSLILPMIITCLGATLVAQWLGGRPIYSQLLERTLRIKAEKERSEAVNPVLGI
ncbi:H(+)/Cl(-) exchange transporter ClcA [Endozoicomonas sp. Mp262]|uniref:H(+)/Cl(-) exchange transporter ClcA n=1 Tax=Endozoicomonas sp. Mp262 TaxID=2919499 RepID=UPI0021D83650